MCDPGQNGAPTGVEPVITPDDILDVICYIETQKQHHVQGTIIAAWEEAHQWNLGPVKCVEPLDASQ